jgi:hypothetical protein
MNVDISNIAAVAAVGRTTAPTTPPPTSSAAETQDSVIVDTVPPTPPDEVLKEIAVAGRMYDKLLSSGLQLHFETSPTTGKLTVYVMDAQGNPVGSIPASKVLQAAKTGTIS